MKNHLDRWEQLATRRNAGPRRSWWSPLDRLITARQNRLEAGVPSYDPPLRLNLTGASAYVLAERGGSGKQFAIPGQPMTWDEAYLAGAFGREGVEKCLDMTITVAREAGATFDWLADHIELPAVERIDEALGHSSRGPGRPAGRLESEAVRKRIARRIKRGKKALREYFGEEWPGHLIAGLESPSHPLPWEKPLAEQHEVSTPSDEEDSNA